jgi:diaminopimelate decarboxylase
LRQGVASGVLINVESAREVALLEAISAELGVPARVAVRVNPDFELKGSGMKMSGGPKQFGIDSDQVPGVLRAIGAARLAFEGFHLFAGSQNLRAEAICDAQQKSFELALRLAQHAPAPVRFLNLGEASAFRTSRASSDSIWAQSVPIWASWSRAPKASCRTRR